MKCLDTTYLIDMIRDPDSIAETTINLEKRETLATTVYNVFEALFGAHATKSNSVRRKITKKLESAFETIQVLSFDFEDAEKAAEIGGTLKRKGKIVGADVITAAIALNNGCDGVVTRNKAHFELIEKVTGLKVIEY